MSNKLHPGPKGKRPYKQADPTLRWYTIRCSNKAHEAKFMVLATRPPMSGSCLTCASGTRLVVE